MSLNCSDKVESICDDCKFLVMDKDFEMIMCGLGHIVVVKPSCEDYVKR